MNEKAKTTLLPASRVRKGQKIQMADGSFAEVTRVSPGIYRGSVLLSWGPDRFSNHQKEEGVFVLATEDVATKKSKE